MNDALTAMNAHVGALLLVLNVVVLMADSSRGARSCRALSGLGDVRSQCITTFNKSHDIQAGK